MVVLSYFYTMKNTIILLLLILSSTYLCAKNIIQGRVIKVTDGDTITLLTKNNKKIKIRLYGIDCPEKGQDYYQVAKNYLSKEVYQKNVNVEVKNKDRYQRSVGIVWLNNTNINLSLLKQGLAWHYVQYDKSATYANAQKNAQLNKKNIWSSNKATAPWEFRKAKRKK